MSFLVISGFMEKGGFLSRLIRSSAFVMRFMKYPCQGKKRELFSYYRSLVLVLVLTSASGGFFLQGSFEATCSFCHSLFKFIHYTFEHRSRCWGYIRDRAREFNA